MTIKQGDAVLLHYQLLLADGSVADSTTANGKPALFRLGDGSLSEAIERELTGLSIGEKKRFAVSAADAFGEREPGLVNYVERHLFPDDIEVVEGAIVVFEHPASGEMPGVIRAITGHSVTVDFNHPLAGEALTFDVEILAINPPQTGA